MLLLKKSLSINLVLSKKSFKKFENVRLKGSDFKIRDIVIKKNTLINSSHIKALKALGIENIRVKKKVNIVFFFIR